MGGRCQLTQVLTATDPTITLTTFQETPALIQGKGWVKNNIIFFRRALKTKAPLRVQILVDFLGGGVSRNDLLTFY